MWLDLKIAFINMDKVQRVQLTQFPANAVYTGGKGYTFVFDGEDQFQTNYPEDNEIIERFMKENIWNVNLKVED